MPTIEDYANEKVQTTIRKALLKEAAIYLIKGGRKGTFVAWYGDHKVSIGMELETFNHIAKADTGVFNPSYTFEVR